MTKHVHGGNVYEYADCLDFSANCNPLGTPESVKQAIIQSLDRVSDYPQVGCAPLREAIARETGLEPENIICGNGAADLIFSLCRAKKPRKALVPAPTFAEYEQALRSVDCEVIYFGLDADDNFQVPEQFLDALSDDLDMIFLCNPNNPTGILTNRELLLKTLEICQSRKIFVVVDECFLDFVKEPEEYTLRAWLSQYPELFLLKAFTKRYAMAGIRLGYGLCKSRELLDQMEAVTQPWNVSSIAQAAGIAALKEKSYVEAGRRLVFQEADYLKKELKRLGLMVYPSQANYLFFKGPEDLFDACVGKGILIRDCSNYPGLGKGYFRVAVKRHEENQKLVNVLEELSRKE
ncbi:MAG: pyridoxal phosphate-dependent class II aminotransferase [Eubacteriales bacterium]|nr:pyridoxal phosphate-dependent class II aminotransferase [Eubacteriales bacterium]